MKKPSKKSDPAEELSFVENLKRQWMATIDALVDPLMIVGQDYQIRKANLALARAADLPIKQVIGKKCYEVFAGRKSPCQGCHLQKAIENKGASNFELDKISDQRFYEVTTQPFIESNGDVTSVIHVYRDRTEARLLREQLLQSEKLSSIGLLAGGVAHEINNPLGGIMVFAQMLARELPKESSHQADVAEILNAAERCKSIVENLLDFARTSQLHDTKNLPPFIVADVVHAALRFGQASIPRHLIQINIADLDTTAKVKGDRNKLIQVLLNLIQNAVQAMPKGGTLSLASQRVDGPAPHSPWLSITVTDSGAGISKEHLKKIFDPFFTTKEPGQGTGLGLSICYGIVKEFGGDLTVHSVKGEGTTFTVLLPLSTTHTLDQSA